MNHFGKLAVILGALFVSNSAAAYQICGQSFGSEGEVAKKSADFVRAMRVAKAQGDIAGMRSAYDSFYRNFAGGCDGGPTAPAGPDLRRVCGYDCHVQLAEYHLFLSSDIEYYAAKGSGGAVATLLLPEEMAKEVAEGVRVVDSAIELLRASNGAASADGLRGYLRDVGALNILRAKLYMAQGDAFYKNISEARIARLAFLSGKAIDQDPAPQGATMVSLARAGYDAALWGLNEALLEIPEESYFNALYLEANALASELKERRNSLLRGLIFVGIDPDEYKPLDINDQKQRLQQTAQNVTQLEGQVENVVRTYLSKKTDIETSNVRNEQELANQSISVSSYRVGTIENLAEQHRAALQASLEKVNATQAGFDRERARVEALFSMNQQTMETNNRLGLLLGAKEVETMTFQRDQVVQQVNDLQWLMNWEVSKTNLELQADGLDAQFVTMDRDTAKSRLTLDQLGKRVDQANNQIAIGKINITKLQGEINTREAQRGPVFEATKRGAAAAICEVEARLLRLRDGSIAEPFTWKEGAAPKTCADIAPVVPGQADLDPALSTKADYIKARCGMKDGATRARIETSADLLLCVVGTDQLPPAVKDSVGVYLTKLQPGTTIAQYAASHCPAVRANCDGAPSASGVTCDDIYKTTKAAYAERMKLAQRKIDAAVQYKATLVSYKSWLIAEVALLATGKAVEVTTWTAMLAGLAAAKSAASAIPHISIGALAGAAGGPITLDFSFEMALEQATNAESAAEQIHRAAIEAQDVTKFVFEYRQKVTELGNQIDRLSAEIDDLAVSKDIQKFETAQAIVEITGRSLDLSGQLQSALAELALDKVECTDQTNDLNSEVVGLQFRHDTLVAQQRAAQLENDLVQGAVDNLKLGIVGEGLGIDNSLLNIADAQLEAQKVQEDIDAIEGNTTRGIVGIRTRTDEQKQKLRALLGQLNQQSDETTRLTAVKNTLSSNIFHASSQLKDEEISHVRDLLDGQKSHASEVLDLLDHIDDSAIASDSLKAQMAGAYLNMQTAIGVERKNMLDTGEQVYTQVRDNKTQEIYLSNEELVSQLTKGIPEFLQEKRRLMQVANFELALLYNKVNALHSTVRADVGIGLAGNGDALAFVRTGDDLTRTVAAFDSTLFRDQAIVQAETISIEIPGTSGFARKLASEGAAELEITPAADGKMAENGYFAVFHDVFKQARAYTILDMNLLVMFEKVGCQRQHFRLYHEGTGFRFFAPGGGAVEPLFFTSAERRHDPKYYVKESDVDEFRNAWNPTLSLFGFWMGQVHPSYDTGALLPLLGTPAIGTYRVELDPAVSENQTSAGNLCSYDNATFRLIVAYSKITAP